MGLMSRNKGKKGELEFAKLCSSEGFQARRGQQFCGANGDADVVGLPGIHIEVKRVEHLNIETAMAQSTHDSKSDEYPIVAHRKNACKWLVTMDAHDWFALYREWFGGTMKTSPCLNCKKRYLSCRTKCDRYCEWHNTLEKLKRAIRVPMARAATWDEIREGQNAERFTRAKKAH